MPEVTEYAPGTPSWVDLASPDPDASARFYGDLFGWKAIETGPVEQTGGYRMLQLDGRDVAGLGPVQSEGQPAVWTTYVSVADADATAARIRDGGGRLMLEPFDVYDAGRSAVFLDAAGAMLAVWQAGTHHGAAVTGDPGSPCWAELACSDTEAAKRFYATVFGWEGADRPHDATTYTEFMLDGQAVGGLIAIGERWPPEAPAHWMVHFAVEDVDAGAARVRELGGTVPVEPGDFALGRFAVVSDPQGAVFSILGRKAAAAD